MTEQYLCKYNTGRNKAIKTPKYISIIRNFFSSICYSTSIFYRCVPDTVPSVATATAETFLQSSGTQTLFEEIVADVEASWKEIIYMSLVAWGLSIIMVILFRFLAGVIVYVIITIIALAAILGPAATW